MLLSGGRALAASRWSSRASGCDAAGIDAEIEPGQRVGLVLGTRQRPDDIEKFLLGQADKRAAQQRAQREGVAPVGEDAGQRDQVLDFLSAKQALARLGRDRNAVPFERLFIAPQIAAGRRKQGDVARPAGPGVAASAGRGSSRCRSGARTFRRPLRLRRRAAVRPGLAVLVGDGDVEGGDTQRLAAIVVERVERGKTRLPIARQHVSKRSFT